MTDETTVRVSPDDGSTAIQDAFDEHGEGTTVIIDGGRYTPESIITIPANCSIKLSTEES